MRGLFWNPARIKILLVFYCMFLLLNTVALVRWSGWITLPGEINSVQYLRAALRTQLDYYLRKMQEYGIENASEIQRSITVFEKAVLNLDQMRDIDKVLVAGKEVDSALQEAMAARIAPRVKEILEQSRSISKYKGDAELIVERHGEDVVVHATDPKLRIDDAAKQSLAEVEYLEVSPLYFSLQGGKLQNVSEEELTKTEVLLEKELVQLQRSLRQALEEAGAVELSGPGIIAEASDALGGFLWVEIVHEVDIRNIVNALFEAGALGVQVGTERFGATSWVRCVGPVVMVNGKQVGANPIVVSAVGEPEKLIESLQDIQEEFSYTGKRLVVRRAENITLAPFRLETGSEIQPNSPGVPAGQ